MKTTRRFIAAAIVAVAGIAIVGQTRAELLLHYKMDADAGGGTMQDFSTYGSTGNFGGSGHQIVSGVIGNALSMSGGSGGNITIPHSTVGQLKQNFANFSYATWINPSETITSNGYLAGMTGGSTPNSARGWYFLILSSGKIRIQLWGHATLTNPSPPAFSSGRYDIDSTFLPPANEWTHIAFTFADADLKIYVNGQELSNSYQGGSLPSGTYPRRLGMSDNTVSPQLGSDGGASAVGIDGAYDDSGAWKETIEPAKMALIHGFGRFVGVDLASTEILDVLNAFFAEGSATAGGYEWTYTSGLSGGLGAINAGALGPLSNAYAFVNDGTAYIVLDDNGNGVQISSAVIPEPSSLALAFAGLIGLGLVVRRRMPRNR